MSRHAALLSKGYTVVYVPEMEGGWHYVLSDGKSLERFTASTMNDALDIALLKIKERTDPVCASDTFPH